MHIAEPLLTSMTYDIKVMQYATRTPLRSTLGIVAQNI